MYRYYEKAAYLAPIYFGSMFLLHRENYESYG